MPIEVPPTRRPPGLTTSEKTLRAKAAAHKSWANTSDPSARTAPGRKAFDERFLNEVDPDRTLPAAERERRAASAKRAYFARWRSPAPAPGASRRT